LARHRGFVPQARPRLMVKNPVMFVTMVGAALTTVGIFTCARMSAASSRNWPSGCGHVLFANFAEAVAEPSKAQARACARARKDTVSAPAQEWTRRKGARPRVAERDLWSVKPETPSRQTAMWSRCIASVDEVRNHGRTAPVIRKRGGDRSA